MTSSLLVEQFQRQEREQSVDRRDHLRAGIPGLSDDPVEPEPGQEWQEEENARDARADRTTGLKIQLATVRDVGRLGVRSILPGTHPGRSSAAIGEKKGGAAPWRQSALKRLAIDFNAEGL